MKIHILVLLNALITAQILKLAVKLSVLEIAISLTMMKNVAKIAFPGALTQSQGFYFQKPNDQQNKAKPNKRNQLLQPQLFQLCSTMFQK